ncbi:restriction endonuclease [Streptacidiphilus sp. N1-10]|uniref:Restriction endonuclease n=1 Tax=Streptacidiphilus jeojiensis TaxID=3229225 RepID=A0ABV6XX56_9ACTN
MSLDIELREHAQPTQWPLAPAVGQALAASRIVEAVPDPFMPDLWRLKASSKVGSVTVSVRGYDPVRLRIIPKVPIARLFFLLGYALNPKGWRDDPTDAAAHHELLPALAHSFERQTERALRQGLLQGYRRAEETALVLRGRIREAEQIRRRFGSSLPVEIAFDEFTTDIAENQLLKAAAERLLRLDGVPEPVRRRLLRHRASLIDITAPVRGDRLPGWRPSRLNVRYQPALGLAELILRGSSVEHPAGAVRIEGFLFDMNRVFEDFVCVALREALPVGGSVELQAHGIHLDDGRAVRMKPDLVWFDGTRHPLAVVDAKYKAEKPEGFPDADLYQLLAYCTALGLREGHLVYAKGNAEHGAHDVRNAGIRIHQHTLDLDQQPQLLLAEINEIARRIPEGGSPESPGHFSDVAGPTCR